MTRIASIALILTALSGCAAGPYPFLDLRADCDEAACLLDVGERYRAVIQPGVMGDDWYGWSAWVEFDGDQIAVFDLTSVGTDWLYLYADDLSDGYLVPVYESPRGKVWDGEPLRVEIAGQ